MISIGVNKMRLIGNNNTVLRELKEEDMPLLYNLINDENVEKTIQNVLA